MKKKKLLILIIILMAALAIFAVMNDQSKMGSNEDGVVEPETVPADWEVLAGDGLSFAYPTEFGTNFISPKVWPPQGYILSVGGALPCAKGDAQAGAMQYQEIGKNKYCITKIDTETSGGTESQYAYTFKSGDNVVAFILSLRYLPCEKMAAERKTACETERAAFNIDSIVDKIASTFTIGAVEEAPENLVAPEGA